jgi:WbqC-like protein family
MMNAKSIAIMQPYFLPYIGYFQLMLAVGKFIVLDDVNYINRGWINRNRMLLNGDAHTFTVPLVGASQNKRICDIELVEGTVWREKLLKTIGQAYRHAPGYRAVWGLVEGIINYPSRKLDEFLLNSLRAVAYYLHIDTEIADSSRTYGNAELKGQDRIIDICKREAAGIYINPIGGTELYGREDFADAGIQLHFLKPRPIIYPQRAKGEFVPWLSILDVLMFNESNVVQQYLNEADLI